MWELTPRLPGAMCPGVKALWSRRDSTWLIPTSVWNPSPPASLPITLSLAPPECLLEAPAPPLKSLFL